MSEKKYVVPEGMLKAVEHEAVNTKWQSSQGGTWIPDGSGFARELLEVALRWLDGQLDSLVKTDNDGSYYISRSMADSYDMQGWNRALTEVRRMFLAPKGKDGPSDVILSLRQIRYDLAERPQSTSLNLVVERLEEILCALGDKPPEPEIPEAVRGLIVDLDISPDLSISRKQFNRDILEAYRRGTLSQNEIK